MQPTPSLHLALVASMTLVCSAWQRWELPFSHWPDPLRYQRMAPFQQDLQERLQRRATSGSRPPPRITLLSAALAHLRRRSPSRLAIHSVAASFFPAAAQGLGRL
jgi:hypothetical protein